jgi:Glycosyl hydrolase family 79 C-terminal beta domain
VCHHARVNRRRVQGALVSAVAVALVAGLVAALSITAGAETPAPTVSASVAEAATGAPLPASYIGLSLEYNWLHFYTGRDPKRVNPVFVSLARNLAPGQTPLLRIGGESTDATWWPIRGQRTPPGISYSLTPRWLSIVRGLAGAVPARLIMGVNMAADRPDLAAAEAHAFLSGIGRRYVKAFEIGNEADNYGVFPWYQANSGHGKWVWARPSHYKLADFTAEFSRFRAGLPATGVAGPAFAELGWLSQLDHFFSAEPRLSFATIHRYPLHACYTDPSSSGYPSMANLLSDQASYGLAQAVAPTVTIAHRHGAPLRLDELNSAAMAACLGRRGVSGTFASALWVLDTLFNLAAVGVDGVNIHTLPGADYQLFSFRYHKGHWEGTARPEYYGLFLFAQAFPAGARLLPVTAPSGPVKIWATRGSKGVERVVLINKDPSTAYQVQLRLSGLPASARLERLQAPSASARGNVTLGGQGFGNRTGMLTGQPHTDTATATNGIYSISLPAASAAVLMP